MDGLWFESERIADVDDGPAEWSIACDVSDAMGTSVDGAHCLVRAISSQTSKPPTFSYLPLGEYSEVVTA